MRLWYQTMLPSTPRKIGALCIEPRPQPKSGFFTKSSRPWMKNVYRLSSGEMSAPSTMREANSRGTSAMSSATAGTRLMSPTRR